MTQERWQRVTYWPLTIASLLFLVAYSWRVIADVQGTPAIWLNAVLVLVWALFLLHFIVGLIIASPRGQWFRKNWWQLIFVCVPALQPVRLLRLVPVLAGHGQRRAAALLRGQIMAYVAFSIVLLVYLGAVMVLDAEENASGSNIRNIGDALWWAVVTVTTVGYGDFVPVTVQGRLVAAALMLSGVALIGAVTGTLASYLGDRARADDPTKLAATKAEVEELEQRVIELSDEVRRLQGGSANAQPGPH